ncbi:MAG: TIGR01777 family protein [Proteobacteria bacterium]|nr:MAG: TIGR01777 family protein [Pseudomonadota bacterium]
MSEVRTVLVTGATGLVGGRLVRALLADRVAVRAVSRGSGARLPHGVAAVQWDGVRVPPAALAGCHAVVHLAGEPVFGGLPNEARRERIRASRVESTRALVAALGELPEAARPRTFVCASAIGYYGSRGEELLPESAAPGRGFLADVCVAWEREAAAAAAHGVRVVSLRIGVVLAREGGALVPIARAFRLGAGGKLGDGQQWFPWIHVDDLVAMIRAALGDERWSGPVNAVGPNPVRNEEFTRVLARAVRRPAWIPVPGFALRAVLGDLADELLGSRRVVPERATQLGFRFTVPTLERALEAEL